MAVYTEVAKLSLPFLAQGAAETIATTDQLLALMPIFNVAPAIQYEWNQESTIYTGNSGSVIAPDGTFTAQSASYTATTQNMTYVGASFTIPRSLSTDSAIAVELAKKSKAVARKMGDLIINGTNSGNVTFNGFAAAISGSATQDIPIATVGSGSFSLTKLDEAIHAVKVGKPNLIVTSTKGLRFFKSALRSTGTTAEYLQLPNYGTPFLQYDGIPVVASDWIHDDINGGESYYVLYANETDGVTLWSNYDMLVQVLGPTQVINSVSDNWVVASNFGMVIPSTLCLARVNGVTS